MSTDNWSPTLVVVGYGRLTLTHVSYLGRTPGSATGASLSLVHGLASKQVAFIKFDKIIAS